MLSPCRRPLGKEQVYGEAIWAGDARSHLAAEAPFDDDGGSSRGAVWVFFLDDRPCPWDFDGNGSVGVSDLLALLANWGPCS